MTLVGIWCCLSDAAITNDGLPSVNPQHLLRVYFNAKKSQ
jgi:hypothetical protein